jgi:CRP/FNR family transcriptional regulator, cyclic AMP receptor protein
MGARPKSAGKHKEGGPFDLRAFLATVGMARTIIRCQKDYIFKSPGESADAIFYIQKGKVKLSIASKLDKEAVIAILGPGDFFGEGCIADQPVRMARATALAPSSVLKIEKSEMLRVIREEPALSGLFMSHLLSRNIRMQEDLADQLFNSSEKRLARALLLLSTQGKRGRPQKIIPEINQQVLADMIGTTRSRVSVFMNKFRRLGFIKYNGGLQVRKSLERMVARD